MRILHVASNLAPSSGGITAVVKGLSTKQAQLGHSVAICTTTSDYPPRGTLAPGAIKLGLDNDVKLHLFHVQFAPMYYSRPMVAWLKKHVREFDILHVHGLYRSPVTSGATQARRQKVPFIIQPHGSLDPYLYAQSSQSVALKRIWERLYDLRNLNSASAIHYTTTEEQQRAAFLKLNSPPVVVPIGVDWARYATLPARGIFRARIGIADKDPLVLFLGRLNFKKGLDLLIPAFARVRSRYPTAVLAIVGPDNEGYGAEVRRWVIEVGVKNNVRFVDRLESASTINAYVDADVFVLPSYTENFGITVAEALACGTPVVISDQVNIYKEIGDSGAGLVTRCVTTDVADAILALLGDRDRRHNMSVAGRSLVQRKWTWDAVAGDLLLQYEKIVGLTHASLRQP